jgi:hypothetical protein
MRKIHDVIADLESVLCDPYGSAVISGSNGDRDIINQALKDLKKIAKTKEGRK